MSTYTSATGLEGSAEKSTLLKNLVLQSEQMNPS